MEPFLSLPTTDATLLLLVDAIDTEAGPLGLAHDETPASAPTPSDGNDGLMSAAFSLFLSSQADKAEAPAARGEGDTGSGIECTLTCNGSPAWFNGLLPCWGVLNVTCSGTSSDMGSRHGSASHQRSLQATAEAHSAAGQGAATAAQKVSGAETAHIVRLSMSSDAAVSSDRTMSFSAVCKGLWTGALGKLCWGLTLQSSSASWLGGRAEKTGVCAGRLGTMAHREADGFTMGQHCKGTLASIQTLVKL